MDASSAFKDSLPTSPETLLDKLACLDISFTTHTHLPLRTVEDAMASSTVRKGRCVWVVKLISKHASLSSKVSGDVGKLSLKAEDASIKKLQFAMAIQARHYSNGAEPAAIVTKCND